MGELIWRRIVGVSRRVLDVCRWALGATNLVPMYSRGAGSHRLNPGPVRPVRFLSEIRAPGRKHGFHWALKARTSKSAPSGAPWPSEVGRSAVDKAPPSTLRLNVLAYRSCGGDSKANLFSTATLITPRPRRPWSSSASKLDREGSCKAHGSTCTAGPRICFRKCKKQASAWPPRPRSFAPSAQACDGRRLRCREPHDSGST